MVGVSASVNHPLHHKVQKSSSGTGSPAWSRKKGRKMVVVVHVDDAECILVTRVCLSVYQTVTVFSLAKTAEPIEMPFAVWTRVGPGNHVLVLSC